jgi:mono/diheme cytochrome c family protein
LKQVRLQVVLAMTLAGAAVVAATIPLGAQATGVYAAPQAQSGAKLFAANCAACHGADLSGTAAPPLAGKSFLTKWSGQTAADIHDVVSTQMPLTAPGSLKPAEYIDLVAFVLSKNGYPAGTAPLEKAKLKNITIKAQ